MFSGGTLFLKKTPKNTVNWENMQEKTSWLFRRLVVVFQHMVLLVSDKETGGCVQSKVYCALDVEKFGNNALCTVSLSVFSEVF